MRQRQRNTNGVILHEGRNIVVIATGIKTKSANSKTGDMIQIWILRRNMSPMAAIKSGADADICGNCVHRGSIIDGKLTARRCYVQVDKAPTAIYRAYERGSYRKVKASEYAALFGGRMVRFGAYGDPVYIPLRIVKAITAVCRDWTGYTHQWKDAAYSEYRSYVMASSDSDLDSAMAVSAGWRYFRVRPAADMSVSRGEIRCPASDEAGKRSTCADCRLCNGVKHGDRESRKNITIIDHSRIAKSSPLINITAA